MVLPSEIGKQDDAAIQTFFESVARLNGNDEMSAICQAIITECHSRLGVYDVGTFKKLDSATLQALLEKAKAKESMQLLLENAMNHKFARISTSDRGAFQPCKVKKSGIRQAKFMAQGERMLGEVMRANGSLAAEIIPDWVFESVRTPDPLRRAISYNDYKALNGAVFNYVLLKHGVVNADKDYLEALAKQIKKRLPNPPVRKTDGKSRCYETGLKNRFANGRNHSITEVRTRYAPVCAIRDART